MKITEEIKKDILEKRNQGFSYARIVKETGVSRTSVIKIVKDHQIQDLPVEAKVLKGCPNPRIILIYFGDQKENFAKCVVRSGMNYPAGKVLQVKKVDTSAEPLYRLA
jgi:intein-encoded DNA endonuclease-like protein